MSFHSACSQSANGRPWILFLVGLLLLVVRPLRLSAQELSNVEPGHFDYYLLNLSWSPEFCSLHDTNPQCATRPGFIVHGLWPENNDDTWPAFCSTRVGPEHPEKNLDITPDASLLAHEWAKHGTCTTLSPDQFFGLEHQAFRAVLIPKLFVALNREVMLKPEAILDLFAKANPDFPAGSFVVGCGDNRLTAIEACFSKDELKPMKCGEVHACHAQVVRIAPEKPAAQTQ
jgi:ribonuclease T2